MNFFNWDIGFILPLHFLEMYLANGVLFETEQETIGKDKTSKETASKISSRAYEIYTDMLKQRTCFKNQGYSAN